MKIKNDINQNLYLFDIKFKLRYQDNFWIGENEDLNLYCWGESIDDLKKSICSDLLFLRDTIMCEKDEKLSPKAKKLNIYYSKFLRNKNYDSN